MFKKYIEEACSQAAINTMVLIIAIVSAVGATYTQVMIKQMATLFQ